MKPFRFSLAAVRLVRQRQEQVSMEHYGKALLVRRLAIERLEAVEAQLRLGWQELRELLAGSCLATAVARMQEHHRLLAERRNAAQAEVNTAELQVNSTLNVMLGARRQREIVDNFLQKQKSRHLREQAREEQKFIDEIAGRRSGSVFAWNSTEAMS